MTEKEKIEFLLNLLKTETFEVDMERAVALVQSYKWLVDQYKEIKEQ